MDQTIRLREIMILQLGSQVLTMCELQAQLDVAKADLADAIERIRDEERRAAERMQAIADARG